MTYADDFKNPERDIYMAVAGGHKIYLRNPKPEDFQPYRTSVSLAAEHRFAGALGEYPVAQHCVLVAGVVKKLGGTARQQLAAVHHEDEEIITGDIPSPFKSLLKRLPGWDDLVRPLKQAVNARYGIDVDDPLVKEADRIVFCAEVRWLVHPDVRHVYGEYGNPMYRADMQPTADELVFWSKDRAKKEYLAAHERLVNEAVTWVACGTIFPRDLLLDMMKRNEKWAQAPRPDHTTRFWVREQDVTVGPSGRLIRRGAEVRFENPNEW